MRRMKDTITVASEKGEEIARKYNAETYIPFPFEEIANDRGDLDIFLADLRDVNPGNMYPDLSCSENKKRNLK